MKYKMYKALLVMSLVLIPVAVFAAGDGGHADSGAVLKDFIYRCFNFALMVGLLAYFVTKPIRKGLKGRTEEIENKLAEAEAAKEAAEAKHREYSEKLAKATEEIASIAASIRREGEMERDKIIANARATAEQMLEEAKLEAAYRVRQARRQLRREVIEEAVRISEESVRTAIGSRDQQRLIREYLQELKQMPSVST